MSYSSISEKMLCCFSLFYMVMNGICLGFELLAEQNKLFENITLGSEKL